MLKSDSLKQTNLSCSSGNGCQEEKNFIESTNSEDNFMCADDHNGSIDCHHIKKEIVAERWNEMFNRLELYKKKYGNCLVPEKYMADLKLSTFVRRQRQLYRLGRLNNDRYEQLNDIGFKWETSESSHSWDNMFQCLLEYKMIHGHCMVPTHYNTNPKLGKWVHKQRDEYKEKRLTNEQIQRLENVEFKWTVHLAMCDAIESLLQNHEETSRILPSTFPYHHSSCDKMLVLDNMSIENNYSQQKQKQQQQPKQTSKRREINDCISIDNSHENNNNPATAKLQSMLSKAPDDEIDMNMLSWDMALSSQISDTHGHEHEVAPKQAFKTSRGGLSRYSKPGTSDYKSEGSLARPVTLLRARKRDKNLCDLCDSSSEFHGLHRKKRPSIAEANDGAASVAAAAAAAAFSCFDDDDFSD